MSEIFTGIQEQTKGAAIRRWPAIRTSGPTGGGRARDRRLSAGAGALLVAALLTAPWGAALAQTATNTAPDPQAEAYKKLVETVQRDPASATADTIAQLAALGKATGRPQAAAATIKNFLAQRREAAPEIWLASADIAALAGDLRSAVTRYKQFLAVAPQHAKAAEARLMLFRLLIDTLGAGDDAYRLLTEFGDAGRTTPALKRYDAWYLETARARRDVTGAAQRLASIFTDQMPLEMERMAYWGYLDWLLRDLGNTRPEAFPAVPACRKLAGLIRESPVRAARLRFLTEHLAYQASAAGKDAAALERDFDPVAAAAQAYLDASPTAAAMREISRVFGGGWERSDGNLYGAQAGKKAPLFPYVFGKMNEAERQSILTAYVPEDGWDQNIWVPILTSRPLYGQLVAANADFFRKSPGAFRIALETGATNPAVHKALSPALAGVPARDAVIIGALGASDDLFACWQRVVQESWFVAGPNDLREMIDLVWATYSKFPREAARKLPDQFNERTYARFGAEVLAQTPAFLFDGELARAYATTTWRFSGADDQDKTRVAERLHRLDWLPYDLKTREYIFGDARREFRTWAEQVRSQQAAIKQRLVQLGSESDLVRKQREAEAKKPTPNLAPLDARLAELDKAVAAAKAEAAKADAPVALITPLEEAFKQCAELPAGDLSKAPNDLCRHLARTVVAVREKNLAAYLEAARAAYPLVRTYAAQRTPFGRLALAHLLRNRFDVFDTFDFQLEVLADQLAQGAPESGNQLAELVFNLITVGETGPEHRHLEQPPRKEQALKLNALLAKFLREQMAKGTYSGAVFGWFAATHYDPQSDLDIVEQLLTRPELMAGRQDRGMVLMSLVRFNFPKLAEKYPLATGFEDLVAADIRKSRRGTWSYFEFGGQDPNRKIANALAEVFGSYERLPFGYDGGPVVYREGVERTHFWNLQLHAFTVAEGPVREAMLAKIESYAGKTRFDHYANGCVRLETLSTDRTDTRKAYFEKLAAWIAAREQEPVAAWSPSLAPCAAIGAADLSDAECDTLARFVQLGKAWNVPGIGSLDRQVIDGLLARKRQGDLLSLAPQFWSLGRQTEEMKNRMIASTARLAELGQWEIAATYAGIGLDAIGGGLREDQRNALVAIRSKAIGSVMAVAAVDRADRRFPMFQAQADFQAGKFQEAWQGYLSNRALFPECYRDLDPAFNIWILGKLTDVGDYEAADATARLLIQWVEQTPQGFDPEDRGRLLLAFAQIPFARQEYPRARAICEQIVAAKEFETTLARRDAELKIAEIDRVTKHFDKAIERLDHLLQKQRDPATQAEGNYQLALVKFDQEEYPEARAYLDKTLAAEAGHANARILEGKVYLRMKKLVEATDVRVGLKASQQTLVPGKPLKVSLEDRNLSVVGQAANITLRAWTDTGDEEEFGLVPFGDSRTKFEGVLPTALAAVRKGDGTLQVLGGEQVHYDFSEKFKRDHKIAGEPPTGIRVVSDAELFASSGRILSREEQEQRELERMIRARVEPGEGQPAQGVALSTVRAEDEVKPGNRINIRVNNPGQSRTVQKDTVTVNVAAASGDRINRVTLTETEPYSGVFEGYVQTASAPATAFASDSAEGGQPNYAITGAEYAPWVGLPDNRRPKWLSVDLNTRVELGSLRIVADVPGRKLRQFVVQTSPNGKDFLSVGAWPQNLERWNGDAKCEIVRYRGTTPPSDLAALREYLETGSRGAGLQRFTVNPLPLDLTWDASVAGLGDQMQLPADGDGRWYVGHLRGLFFVGMRQRWSFRLATGAATPPGGPRAWLMLNGRAGRERNAASASLGRGLHRLDVYFFGSRREPPAFWLETDQGRPGQWVKCTAEMFSPPKDVTAVERAAMIDIVSPPLAVITNLADNAGFTCAFPSNAVARSIRLLLLDFETDAPAIHKLHLTDRAGKRILPTEMDVVKLRENDVLEIVPGDRVSVTYENPSHLTKERQFSEAFMRVTYHDATLSACFIESDAMPDGTRRARYIPIRRFRSSDTIVVFVNDPDCDTSDAPDKVTLSVLAGQGGAARPIEAIETEPHSGVFLGKIFPVPGAPQRPSEIQLQTGDDVFVSYLDAENNDPGVPTERRVTVEQVVPSTPELRLFAFSSRLLSTQELASVAAAQQGLKRIDEVVPVTRSILAARPDSPTSGVVTGLLGCPIVVELTYPTIALSPLSRTTLYAQTSSGRQLRAPASNEVFDVQVPGTVRFEVSPGDGGGFGPPPGYRDVTMTSAEREGSALDAGRFTFVIPARPGPLPQKSLIDAVPAAGSEEAGRFLTVRPGDTVFIGYPVPDATGSNRWRLAEARFAADAFLDVMDRRYQEPVASLSVGETVYVRVVNPAADTSDEKDEVKVQIKTNLGDREPLILTETLGHSGVFKGLATLLYTGDPARSNATGAVAVDYGDRVEVSYAPTGATARLSRAVLLNKGSDGMVSAFTKRFNDPAVAVQTQFTIAESYFEMAKKHREIGQEDVARREIGQGKKLLEESIRDYPNTEARAQADYLLANLALEFATQAEKPEQKQKYNLEAITRFTDLIGSYPDSPYAPKAQFKKALAFEKMGRIDEACEEYVKLSYRYPDNELVAETIARLGQYFYTKGKALQDQMAEANKTDRVAGEKLRLQMLEMYTTAAQVFSRLAERFPDHKLAGRTSVLSGQCYMRAENYGRAIAGFTRVIEAKKAEPEVIAEAMYWCGDSYLKHKDSRSDTTAQAYRMFKKLTWDYPESVWAKHARGRLTEDALAQIDAKEAQ